MCAAIGERARRPVFFSEFAVPDTIDGRFDLVALHGWMVLEALRNLEMKDISQGLIDSLFISFDEGLRDLGVGDIGIGHRMKKLADAFYGRLSAYGAAADERAMADALARNLYRGEPGREQQAAAMARYALAARDQVAAGDLASGKADFGPLPVPNGKP
ncbi:MAG TPA: ubiquinol-cytochrome C chaperone family protein [Rhizomicrobium sp.]|nr:ubiquinol-cytochrome C chaperone family protein [Rhizomicrobium sp.]